MKLKKLIKTMALNILLVTLPKTAMGEPALTIYNENFAVVRESVPIKLKTGIAEVRYNNITAHVQPGSVILRDPGKKENLTIVEQNYQAEPISQSLLLSIHEGKTIDFLVQQGDTQQIVQGKIIRSAYVPHRLAMQSYGQQYYQTQSAYSNGDFSQPIIEVEKTVRFGIPGTPLFPPLADDTILKPSIIWKIRGQSDQSLNAELSYITGGMSWLADYNVIAPEKGSILDLVGLVTINNQSGLDFKDARVKLMAGDVNKIQENNMRDYSALRSAEATVGMGMGAPISAKQFDEYHLYLLKDRTTVHDRESKQMEFSRASGIKSKQRYIYDGAAIDESRYRGYNLESIRGDQNYGTISNPKIWVMQEFKNSTENGLGEALPKGRVHFYRQDSDGQLELTGENVIDHTPSDETLRIYTGNAFDLIGERKRTNYNMEHSRSQLDESFEITLRNHKKEKIEVTIVEHLYRWSNWEITQSSDTHLKTESQTAEFLVQVPSQGEKKVTYTVHYTW